MFAHMSNTQPSELFTISKADIHKLQNKYKDKCRECLSSNITISYNGLEMSCLDCKYVDDNYIKESCNESTANDYTYPYNSNHAITASVNNLPASFNFLQKMQPKDGDIQKKEIIYNDLKLFNNSPKNFFKIPDSVLYDAAALATDISNKSVKRGGNRYGLMGACLIHILNDNGDHIDIYYIANMLNIRQSYIHEGTNSIKQYIDNIPEDVIFALTHLKNIFNKDILSDDNKNDQIKNIIKRLTEVENIINKISTNVPNIIIEEISDTIRLKKYANEENIDAWDTIYTFLNKKKYKTLEKKDCNKCIIRRYLEALAIPSKHSLFKSYENSIYNIYEILSSNNKYTFIDSDILSARPLTKIVGIIYWVYKKCGVELSENIIHKFLYDDIKMITYLKTSNTFDLVYTRSEKQIKEDKLLIFNPPLSNNEQHPLRIGYNITIKLMEINNINTINTNKSI